MKIDSCEFPDDLLYDAQGFTWVREVSGEAYVGITSLLAAVAGKLVSVRAKPTGVIYGQGEGIGSLESGRHFDVIRTPVRGTLVAVNDAVLHKPKLLSDSPYTDGWFARLRPEDWAADREALSRGEAAREILASQIAALRAHCFAAFPDYEMYEIGVECSAVLVKLNELIARIELGEVIHIVSDDATAPVEMARWSDDTGQPVVDARREANLFHYLVRRVR